MKKFITLTALILTHVLMLNVKNASAQLIAYPTKPIRFIVTFPPGGSTTIVARLIGQKLTESWGQPVVVENRPGANSVIGTEVLVKSPPDGHTILLVVNTHVINPLVMKLPYDTFKDFAPITTVYSTEYVMVTHPSVPANSLQEFISLAKSKPDQFSYASGDNGGITHLVSEMFNAMAGLKLQNVPYKGSAPALADTLGGHVQVFFGPPIVALSHIQSGKLKALAQSGDRRSPTMPQVPTFSEAGLPGYDVTTWYGVLAPAGTPRPIIDKLAAEIHKIMEMPEIKEKLANQGLEPRTSSPEQFESLMRSDMAKFERVIKRIGISIQ